MMVRMPQKENPDRVHECIAHTPPAHPKNTQMNSMEMKILITCSATSKKKKNAQIISIIISALLLRFLSFK